MSFLLESLPWVSPDLPDDLAGDVLWVKAEERENPGDRLPFVCGQPHVPADEVVQEVWHEHHGCPSWMWGVGHVIHWSFFVVASDSLFDLLVFLIAKGVTAAPDEEFDAHP